MNPSPLVSVIIPVYNTERYVGDAVKSVLEQTYHNFEVILVDDGSTDKSLSALEIFGSQIRVYKQEHQGIGATRNRAIEEAKGAFLAFLDADDIWMKDKLENQIRVFQEQPDLEICLGLFEFFLSPDLDEETRKKKYFPKGLLKGYLASATLVRRASFDKVGSFATNWKVGEFVDWFARVRSQKLKMAMLPRICFARRIHATNHGVVEKKSRGDYLRILKASLDRRRELKPAKHP